jgi:hypothetical protein
MRRRSPPQLGGPLHAQYKSVVVAFDRSGVLAFEQAKLWNALCWCPGIKVRLKKDPAVAMNSSAFFVQ